MRYVTASNFSEVAIVFVTYLFCTHDSTTASRLPRTPTYHTCHVTATTASPKESNCRHLKSPEKYPGARGRDLGARLSWIVWSIRLVHSLGMIRLYSFIRPEYRTVAGTFRDWVTVLYLVHVTLTCRPKSMNSWRSLDIGFETIARSQASGVQLFTTVLLVPMPTPSFKPPLSSVNLSNPPPRIGDNVLSSKFVSADHNNLCVT